MRVIAHVPFSLLVIAMMGLNTDHIKLFDHFVHEIVTSFTPRSRVLPEKLAGPQLINKFPPIL